MLRGLWIAAHEP